MRVIGGRFRGHPLVQFKASHIRPTTDRVKETIFNILQNEVDGARVLDLFSGTGSLSIEALSRGASHVDSVESHKGSLKIIHQNLSKLKISDDIEVHGKDVFRYLKKYSGEPYDLIFIDPPFTKKWADQVMRDLSHSSTFSERTVIFVEATIHEKVESQYGVLKKYDERHFGDKIVFFFQAEQDNN